MSESSTERERSDDAILTYDVADEALEAAAGAGETPRVFTIAMCTGQEMCPF
ncbi:MAG TPA: hypothetical protein VMJ52_05750 [Xanthobacteraceae bacterium]|nr:hypothetical protein [Xanthobacteraceae bacterium]